MSWYKLAPVYHWILATFSLPKLRPWGTAKCIQINFGESKNIGFWTPISWILKRLYKSFGEALNSEWCHEQYGWEHNSRDVLRGIEWTRDNFLNCVKPICGIHKLLCDQIVCQGNVEKTDRTEGALTRCYDRNTYFIMVVSIKPQKTRWKDWLKMNTCWGCLVTH